MQYFFFSFSHKCSKLMTLRDMPRMFFLCYYFFLFFFHFLFNTESTRKFVSVCPLGQLLFIQKFKRKMDPIFEDPAFDLAREKIRRFIRQPEKSQETFENSLYTCFKCGSNNAFSIAKQVRSADEGTSVFNECRDCHSKWRDG